MKTAVILWLVLVSPINVSDNTELKLQCSDSAAKANDTVILQCQTVPTVQVTRVEWTFKKGDEWKDVHLYRKGADDFSQQAEMFTSKTSVFKSELLSGNFSLKLEEVQTHHTGNYRCSVRADKPVPPCYVDLTVSDSFQGESKDQNPANEEESKDPTTTAKPGNDSWSTNQSIGVGVGVGGLVVIVAVLIWKKHTCSKKRKEEPTEMKEKNNKDPNASNSPEREHLNPEGRQAATRS